MVVVVVVVVVAPPSVVWLCIVDEPEFGVELLFEEAAPVLELGVDAEFISVVLAAPLLLVLLPLAAAP